MRQSAIKLARSFLEGETTSILYPIFLIALCCLLYFPYLGATPLFDKGEPREALAVQDILQRGEWLFPLKGAGTIPSKPPLFHWSAAVASKIAGTVNEATIRFPSAFYATLGVIAVYLFGRRLFGPEIALLSGAILGTLLVFEDAALSARVDMTLCFFVTVSLMLFYSLYRGWLRRQSCYYLFYVVVGFGTLAKGPLGILLPALVIGSFVVFKRRWDLISKFCFHPGVTLTLLIAAGWYGMAVLRGGEGFVDRQILKENLERFFGGSGHSHPIYYYVPYLFSQGLPWTLFLPFVIWDWFKNKSQPDEDQLFLRLWLVAMFSFFSLSMGKRPVYLLPLYPAVALMTGAWIYHHGAIGWGKRSLYRAVALVALVMGLALLVISVGALWSHDSGWFLAAIERFLKAKDRANLLVVKDAISSFGWSFTAASLLSGILWLSFAHCLWGTRLQAAALRLVVVALPLAFLSYAVVMPVIAGAKSYRPFVAEVARLVAARDKLFLYGEFNPESVIFYWGAPLAAIDAPLPAIAAKVGRGESFIIMPEKSWSEILKINPGLPSPMLRSTGTGPEGDARLILVQAEGA